VARWQIQVDVSQDLVTLTYFESVLPGGKPPKNCGSGGLAVLADLEAWCADQASPWDQLQTERGVFVRQVSAFVRA